MALSESDKRDIQDMIDSAYQATSKGRMADMRATVMRVMDALDRGLPKERVSFFNNYKIFNATVVADVLPRGTLFVTDAGTTPSRSVALIYSDGIRHIQLAAVVL